MRTILTAVAGLVLFAAPGFAQTCVDSASAVFINVPKVIIGGLGVPTGDERLRFKGEVTFPHPNGNFSPPLDPAANGVRVLVHDSTGATVVDETVPGGAFNSTTLQGWVSINGRYKFRREGVSATGIRKVVLKDRSARSPGLIKFTVSAKNGTYVVAAGNLPLRAALVLDPPATQCGAARFPGPSPLPSCTMSPSGNSVACK